MDIQDFKGEKTGVFAMQAGPGAENAFAGLQQHLQIPYPYFSFLLKS
ncbi:MAG: hypothetical protein CM1200mP38_2990 [Dehalococcoidia bacterium]|nr:MAG: hypothetical protein CM1200mP38_2990 [Dehalococcoidia bacterium]